MKHARSKRRILSGFSTRERFEKIPYIEDDGSTIQEQLLFIYKTPHDAQDYLRHIGKNPDDYPLYRVTLFTKEWSSHAKRTGWYYDKKPCFDLDDEAGYTYTIVHRGKWGVEQCADSTPTKVVFEIDVTKRIEG